MKRRKPKAIKQYWPEGYRPGPTEILLKAIEVYKPVAMYAGFSGGDGSSAAVKWMMDNTATGACEVFHSNTGIGIEATRVHVRKTCAGYGWPLHEIRAKEDCGQDYDEIVRKHGFPGPDAHQFMYSLLKERCVRLLVKRAKEGHSRYAKVLIASGVCHFDSNPRMGYAGKEINVIGSQVWINPLYWWTKEQRDAYRFGSGMPRNPVADELGMSGECGCGAYAQRGELQRWEKIDPAFGARIRRLQDECLERGFTWSWEGRPPNGGHSPAQQHMFAPMCAGCIKSAVVQEALSDLEPSNA
jgi:3'-phosphoadenosine 5'-phosphosulfate sulfotransferase (PAPS reductase)/FAD synthetase